MDTLFEYQRPIGQIVRELRSDRQFPTGPRLFSDVMRAYFHEDVISGLAAAQVVIERIESARHDGARGYLAFQDEWDMVEQAFRELLESAQQTRMLTVTPAH